MNTELTAPILIISIKHRPWYLHFSINHWDVQVEYKNRIYNLVCWAGTDDPSPDHLRYSIREKLGEKLAKDKPRSMEEIKKIYEMIGTNISPE